MISAVNHANTNLYTLLQQIVPADREAMRAAATHWDQLAKPLHSLGRMEDAITKIAGIQGTPAVKLDRRAVAVFCADNGVVAQQVTQCGSDVTASVAREMAEGNGNINALSRAARADVFVYDVGMAADDVHPNIYVEKSACGTADISCGPAMSRAQAEAAILTGIHVAKTLKQQGYDILIGGEMGIGNTTTTATVAAVLLGDDPAILTGRGSGLSNAGLIRKTAVVKEAIACNRPDAADPIDVLAKVGGFDLAAMCGLYLGGAVNRIPVVVDGVIAAAAALCACRLQPLCGDYLLASHVSGEPASRLLLQALELEPMIDAGMALGEGSGGVVLLPILDLALSVYDQGSTFERFGIRAYTPQEGAK